jgi:hypothetical protein
MLLPKQIGHLYWQKLNKGRNQARQLTVLETVMHTLAKVSFQRHEGNLYLKTQSAWYVTHLSIQYH